MADLRDGALEAWASSDVRWPDGGPAAAEYLAAAQVSGAMQLIIQPAGEVVCVYDEAIDLAAIGGLTIRRASHVNADEAGQWFADLAPVSGPMLGPFDLRSEALAAEQQWLDNHLAAISML